MFFMFSAILYESIYCMMYVKAEVAQLDVAAQHVNRFLHSNNPNLKTIGMYVIYVYSHQQLGDTTF